MRTSGKTSTDLKQPPNATDIELSILGSILSDNSCLPRVMGIVTPDSFYDPKNKIIFEICTGLFEEREPIDSISVYEEAKKLNLLDKIGGIGFIGKLTENFHSSANVDYHARILLEKAVLRNLIKLGNELVTESYSGTKDVFDILSDAEKKLIDTSSSVFKNDAVRLKEVYKEIIKHIEHIKNNQKNKFALDSGFIRLDEIVGGFRKGESIIIAARPSMGKTSLAWCIAKNVDVPVAFFSLEMSKTSLGSRALGIDTAISPFNILSGKVDHNQMTNIMREVSKCNRDVFIDDTPALSPLELKSKSMRMKLEHGVGLIIIDYLQLMKIKGKTDGREREISEISQSIKNLAKELDVPVVALSQLSRRVEERQDKRPLLSDLRESGSIEQDADVVMFLYRPEYYDIQKFGDGADTEGLAEIIVAKNRNGSIGEARVRFIKERTLFENLSSFSTEESI